MRVLVTGGAGFIGSHICDALVERGDEVSVVDSLSTGSAQSLSPSVRFYKVDINSHSDLERVFLTEHPAVVCHQAAQVDVRSSMADMYFDATVNILGTLNVIDLCLRHVSRLVFASSCAVYPSLECPPVDESHPTNPASAYGLSKYAAEQYLRLCHESYGLKYAALRYGNVFGPGQNPDGECGVVGIFAKRLLQGLPPVVYGDGRKTRDYVYVNDVARANLSAIDNVDACGAYNIGRGVEVSDWDVLTAITTALKVSVEPVFKAKRAGEVERVALDCRKARQELSWTPTVSFRDGIRLTTEFYKNMHSDDCLPTSEDHLSWATRVVS